MRTTLDPSRRRVWIGWLILVPALLLAIQQTTPLIEYNRGFDSDGVFYGAMATEPSAFLQGRHVAPYCWRIVTPLLASLLPFPLLDSFRVLAFLSAWLNLGLCYALLRACGLSPGRSVWGVALFAGVFWVVKFSFYSPAYIDYQTTTFSLAILLASASRRYAWVPPLLALGVLQKESILSLAPVVYAYFGAEHGWASRRTLAYSGLGLLLLPALALTSVRLLIEPENTYSVAAATWINLRQIADPEFWPRFTRALSSGLGLLPAMLLLRPRSVARFLRANPQWWVLLVVGSLLLFGGIDKARLFLFMLPAVLVSALRASDVGDRVPASWLRAWMGLTLTLQLYLGHLLTPMGTFAEYISRMVPIQAPGLSYRPHLATTGALIGGWWLLTLLTYRLLRNRSRSEPSTSA